MMLIMLKSMRIRMMIMVLIMIMIMSMIMTMNAGICVWSWAHDYKSGDQHNGRLAVDREFVYLLQLGTTCLFSMHWNPQTKNKMAPEHPNLQPRVSKQAQTCQLGANSPPPFPDWPHLLPTPSQRGSELVKHGGKIYPHRHKAQNLQKRCLRLLKLLTWIQDGPTQT